jgi:peptidoglycan L-alanyl-D-glutamate endopeptidase CwlK
MDLVDNTRAIQRAVGAEPDGIYGPETARMILAHLSTMELVSPNAVPLVDLDDRTRENIMTLDAKARERFAQLARLGKATAASLGCDWVMISGHRTWEEQDALFAKKPPVTNARGGESNHNFGIAGDFAVFRGKSYLDATNPILARRVHEACAVHARKLGFEWGGDWKRLKDFPHFEISTGLTLAQKRKLYQEKGSVL